MGWSSGDKEETIMDVGCGPGRLTRQFILPCFPNLKEIFAIDAVPEMIELAKKLHPHPKVEYIVANFEESSLFNQWKGNLISSFLSNALIV
ncbi:methyltransf_25 domain-containing protein [Caerostris extrusa]|uniref:Methyltransf_25 domain-containing protein n=1 Tax=Caerostris extrusa TaxID=172846 RepID=A0AAV4UHK9_CAEEX|nr:methyltransf_25 domain-containing protein [Caerostris extrusa]